MTWTRLDDGHFFREDVAALSRSASLLHVEALVHCNNMLTDGRLATGLLARITTSGQPTVDAAELVKAGLWSPVKGGWQIDWDGQETAEKVEVRREANAARVDAYRRRGALHAAGDHSQCTATCPRRGKVKAEKVTRDVTRDVTQPKRVCNGTPSRPVPTQREGRKGERRTAASRAVGSGTPPKELTADELHQGIFGLVSYHPGIDVEKLASLLRCSSGQVRDVTHEMVRGGEILATYATGKACYRMPPPKTAA